MRRLNIGIENNRYSDTKSIRHFIYHLIFLYIYLSVYLPIYLSIYLSIYILPIYIYISTTCTQERFSSSVSLKVTNFTREPLSAIRAQAKAGEVSVLLSYRVFHNSFLDKLNSRCAYSKWSLFIYKYKL